MGQGPTIQEMAEKNEQFREYLNRIRSELETEKQKDAEALDQAVKTYYEQGGWSYKPLIGLEKVDVQQVSAWSLDNVNKMLKDVAGAMFGESEPPDGVEIEKPATFSSSLQALSSLNLLAVSKAFSIVQGILETFATETSYKGQSILREELIAPGLTLFISIRSDTWKQAGFFNNQSIAQYLYVVKAYFSLDQAGDLSKFNDLLAYEELKAAWRARILAITEKIADPATPFPAVIELEQEVGYYASQLSKIQAEIDALQKKEVDSHMERVRAAVAARRVAAIAE